MRRNKQRVSERGVALILVLTALLGLMVLAVPFLDIARHEEAASVAPLARAEARARAEATLRYGAYVLEAGHAGEELQRSRGDASLGGRAYDTPTMDTAEEAVVPIDIVDAKGQVARDRDGVALFHHRDSKGSTVDLRVREEQAWPNIFSSTPFLLSATLGRSVLAKDMTETDAEMRVEDGSFLVESGGYVNVEGEVIGYTKRSGNVLSGLSRGLEGGRRAGNHSSDVVVFDDRCREIAMLPFRSPRANGGYREPMSISCVKEIALLGRDALSDLEADKLADQFSLLGRRPQSGAFGEKISILQPLDPATAGANGFPVQVATVSGFNMGTLVRLSDGVQTEYGFVISVRSGQGAQGSITLAEAPSGTYEVGRATLQPLLRHPVNINAAPAEVLQRLISGLQISYFGRPRGSSGRVTEEAASIVVEGIEGARPIRNLKHLRELLDGWVESYPFVVTPIMAEAIFRNALDSNDTMLWSSTQPFCYESYDHYTLEVASIVNDGSGRELARTELRERVHVAPRGVLQHSLDSQEDFEQHVVRARSARYVVTFPNPVERWVSATEQPVSRVLRMLWNFGDGLPMAQQNRERPEKDDVDFSEGVFPSTDAEAGFVKLSPGRMMSSGYNKHFDGPAFHMDEPGVTLARIDADGWRLNRGPFEVDPRDPSGGYGGGMQSTAVGMGRGGGRGGGGGGGGGAQTVSVQVSSGPGQQGNFGQGALMGRSTINPARFDFWYQFGGSAGGRHVLFDFVGSDPNEARVQLVRENDGSLVARVHDRTIDDPADSLTEVMEVKWLPQNGGWWKPRTWYHLGVAYRGSKPDDVMVFADGYRHGKPKYKARLVAAFAASDGFFSVDDAEGWPNRGVAMVGSEVIDFDRNGESFNVTTLAGNVWGRGQRGTKPMDHAAGEPVTLFGYSTLPLTGDSRSGIALPRGGGTLRGNLGPMRVATFQANATVNIVLQGPGGLPLIIPMQVHDPALPAGNMLSLMADSAGSADFSCFPETGGYILIVSQDIPVQGAPVGGLEVARYQSRVGNQLIGLSAAGAAVNPALAGLPAQPSQTAPGFSVVRKLHPVSLAGTGPVQTYSTLSCVLPISISVDNTTGYVQPDVVQGQAGGGTGVNSAWNTDPEFVQIGLPNLQNLDAHDVEWIRYHHVDATGHLICDEARFLYAAGMVLRSAHLSPAGGIIGAHNLVSLVLPFRQQCGTRALSTGALAGNSEVVPCFRSVSHGSRSAINNPNWTPTNPLAPASAQDASSVGWGDSITIEDMNGRDRLLAKVAWAALDEPRQISFGPQGNQTTFDLRRNYPIAGWAAFTESPGRDFRQRGLPGNGEVQQRTGYLRMLKFPSGELPDFGRTARAFAGGDIDGTTGSPDGYVDELRVTPFASQRYILWDHERMDFIPSIAGSPAGPAAAGSAGIDATTDEIPLANVRWVVSNPAAFGPTPPFYILADGRKVHYDEELNGFPRNDAGVIQIGEEIIAFRRVGRSSAGAPALLDCQRGFMQTMPMPHGFGEEVIYLDFVNLGQLRSAIDATNADLPVTSSRGYFADGGTVLIDDEMVHYSGLGSNGLSMPWMLNDAGEPYAGLLRGRYGTRPAGHQQGALVLDMPFRYWDRHAERQDTGEQSFYGFSLDLPGAYFREIVFDERRHVDNVDLQLLVRTDPSIPWSADPAKTPGLYLFDEATADKPAQIRRSGRGLDVRVLFRYLPGAFSTLLDTHDWKASPELHSLRVDYLDETRVATREDLR
ncbi:MAG: hypothetical protein EXS14_05480 [Planctomycetes bacterium]|nr:hypothetical protein [Planctomycetota bacterium]